jgi:DeoR/GlpR family transcriptional regulator of sugar metabolism
MYKQIRLEHIKKILLKEKQITVHDLSTLLNVSVVTIRGDLKELESENFLTRTHGGAIINKAVLCSTEPQSFVAGPTIDYDKRKELIGQVACRFISDSEWVFLGSGTTAFYVARSLTDRNSLNILTNNLLVAYELTKNPLANVMMTGGTLSHTTFNLGGEIFESTLQPITISKAFISLIGIDLNNAYTVSTSGELNVFKVIRSISKQLFIIVDSSKFDKTGFIKVGELLEADAIITDALPPQKYVDYYHENGIPIYTPYDFTD